MPQKTNLNISPYYDDFDKADNFYKVLFKPGFPVQARELTNLQSILQNQLEAFGSHIFKEGSMVIPGGVTYDSTYFSCKVNPDHLGVDISIYLDALINNNNGKGTRVIGQNSQIVGTIKNYVLPPNEGVDDITIFLKYNESGTDFVSNSFPNSEILILDENVTYGNTTLVSGETVLTLVPEDASTIGSSVGVDKGIYFIRGTFVDVPKSVVVLEPYSNKPSYRVGFEILETIVSSNDDPSLNDNAKGFTNFAAPGADRFKITVKLSKKALLDYNDTNFIELVRVRDGEIKKLQNSSVYSEIKKYLAKRTYDESGNYAVNPFRVNLQNSLNDEISSAGLYTEGQKTDEGNDPSDDMMCVKLSPGKAYVRGFDVALPGTTVLDVDKPRDTKTVKAASVPFRMGSMIKVDNVQGVPFINIGEPLNSSGNNVIGLYNKRKMSSGTNDSFGNGLKVGEARVYWYGVSDEAWKDASTEWDLYLFDVQTYTTLQITNSGTFAEMQAALPETTLVKGVSSGALGYVAEHLNPGEIALVQTSGSFIEGEQLKFNGQDVVTGSSVKRVIAYSVDDIRSVFQDADGLSTASGYNALATNFSADTVLYDRILPNFSSSDELTITGVTLDTEASAICPKRRFSGKVGIRTDAIVGFSTGGSLNQTYNRVDAISADGTTLTLNPVLSIENHVDGVTPWNVGVHTTTTFRIKSPKLINLNKSGLYTRLPKKNVSNIDVSSSTMIVTRQVAGKLVSNGELTLSSADAYEKTFGGNGNASGISSAFFEPYDAERYSISYANGTQEPLTSDKVTILNNGNDIKFTGLTNNSICNVIVTMKKIGLASRSKDYVRSSQTEITRTVGVSTNGALTQSPYYGVRVEDKEICLNVPDVAKIHAVYESKDRSIASLDKLRFVSGLGLDVNTVVGEKVIGEASRAIGQIVNRVSGEEIEFVYLNGNTFDVGETVKFKESSIEANIQEIYIGNYVDRTSNYTLDKGHKKQYADYSRLVRKNNASVPSKRLLVIFDYYKNATGNVGEFYSVNSYTKDRYTNDIPSVGRDRASDIIDFRPRVNVFDPSVTTKSPFAFSARGFENTSRYVITPNESTVLGYTYYLPRIDKLVINKFEQVKLIKGVSADKPAPPTEVGDSMEVAQINLPPYLYDPIKGPTIKLFDNRRFTMRDIGKLEKRIDNLEIMTSLTALELDTKSLQVTDADGLDRFKTGFVVNDFKDRNFIDYNPEDGSRCDVDVVNRELISAIDFWSIPAQLAFDGGIDTEVADLSANLKLLDPNCQKTGDILTLAYTEADWIDQPQATQVENINPFNVIVYVGGILLDPASDNWTRTIYIDDHRIESTGAEWAESSNVVSDNTTVATDVSVTDAEVEADQDLFDGNHIDTTTTTTTTTTRTIETSFTNQLEGPSREFDYVESVKISGEADQYMRSRNVAFSANGLKPLTKHYHYLDSGSPDIFPKLIEISMESGSFSLNEDAKIISNGVEIGNVRVKAPNHKFGDASISVIPSGMGTVSVNVEVYSIDPFDRTRPTPGATYSATSKLFNCDTQALANDPDYYGYVVKGAKIIGQSSGATASVTNIDIISDNWGDILGAFFFRDANQTPPPPALFFTGTKTFKVTATPPGTVTLPGSTAHASDATGTYSGTGTILTQQTSTVGVRNPPPPAQRPNDINVQVSVNSTSSTTRVEAPYRDPLAQTFTVDESGAFLTSVDVYFGSKDPNSKVFVEVREVELGTPTSFLVQDFAQVALNPNDIQISDDASIATNIKFPSPIYLESGKEYALVFLSPGSDLYEMWCATMGQKTVKTSNLPDVESVVVSKQYIGGSLFKSQNGTIWTPSQYQDLTFKLYKAEFVPAGTVTFYNTDVEAGNENTQALSNNPIRTLPRKLKLAISLGAGEGSHVAVGRKISTGATGDEEDDSITGIVEGTGAPINTSTQPEIIAAGAGYKFVGETTTGANNENFQKTSIELVSLTGNGSGATATIVVDGVDRTVIEIDSVTAGSGYQVGDVLTINNEQADVIRGGHAKFAVAAVSSSIDTLYLTDVQGEKIVNGDTLIHYGPNKDTRTAFANATTAAADSVVIDSRNEGNVIEVIQYNHAHHGLNNKVEIKDIRPDSVATQTTENLSIAGQSVSVASTTSFVTYAGVTTDRGQALIENEVVDYVVQIGTLSITGRGMEGSGAVSHPTGSSIQPYEINGFPLAGINSTFSLPTTLSLQENSNIDNYYLEVDRGTSSRKDGKTMVCFTDHKSVGGNTVKISQNHQFSSLSSRFNIITPGQGTRASASVRTVSGTSANGNEVSFIDQGFEPTILNETTFFPTPRMVCSKLNESERLEGLPRNKSLALKVDMTSNDKNLSPVLDIKNATFVMGRSKINNPIGIDNYATDSRTNAVSNDPHGSIFVSRRVNLKQPATSLKVLVAANVRPEADFRVFYRLFTADSSEVSQSYRAFPGYKNLIDTDGDGFGDVIINQANNDGRSDAIVKKNGLNDFSEYQFSIDDLEQFNGFTIKIVMTSTNECVPVRLKDFRAIALA
tara:strand:+ start:20129 stop:27685 length:7557 start_codon:yes stop_codon:yes gene_type:complete